MTARGRQVVRVNLRDIKKVMGGTEGRLAISTFSGRLPFRPFFSRYSRSETYKNRIVREQFENRTIELRYHICRAYRTYHSPVSNVSYSSYRITRPADSTAVLELFVGDSERSYQFIY